MERLFNILNYIRERNWIEDSIIDRIHDEAENHDLVVTFEDDNVNELLSDESLSEFSDEVDYVNYISERSGPSNGFEVMTFDLESYEDTLRFIKNKKETEQQYYQDCLDDFEKEMENLGFSSRDGHHYWIDNNGEPFEIRFKDHSYKNGAGNAYGFNAPDAELVFESKEQYENDISDFIEDIKKLIKEVA